VLSSRREEVLQSVRDRCAHSDQHIVQTLDLTEPDSLRSAADTVRSEVGPIDVLVNNGGISQRGTAAETDMNAVRRIMEINFFGTVELTKAVLPDMQKRGNGHIAVVSSVVGKFSTPYRTSYAASKHALHGWYDGLRAEVHDDNIGVTLVCPGFVRTNVGANALDSNGNRLGERAREKGMPPEDCAAVIGDAIEQDRAETYVGGWETIGIYIKRFFPALFRRFIRQYDST
jgi:short-subunit dehydrogenase